MEELIAKRYIKAIKNSFDVASIENIAAVFAVLAESFKDERFTDIINNPDISDNDKLDLFLELVKSANSDEVNNLIKLLVENNRLNIIPAIAEVLRKDLADTTKTYTGIIYSDSDIDTKVIEDLSSGLGKRFDSNISLSFTKNDFNGIKVAVDDLGVEINFSKTRINEQMIEHIIKAI
jgi:F-type H+-transporting ATPase subunit delta